jgi:hypothetical protein
VSDRDQLAARLVAIADIVRTEAVQLVGRLSSDAGPSSRLDRAQYDLRVLADSIEKGEAGG